MVFWGRQVPIWHTLTEVEVRQCRKVAEGGRDRAGQLSTIWPYKCTVSCISKNACFVWTVTNLDTLTEVENRKAGEAEGVRDRAGQLSTNWPYKPKVSCVCTDGILGSTGTDLA